MDLTSKKAVKTNPTKKLKTDDEPKRTVNEVQSYSSESSYCTTSSDSSDEDYSKKRKKSDRKKKTKKLKKKSKCILISETISTIEAKIGICPECRNDDETEMIGCDRCNEWWHYRCAGITVEPKDEDSWFCKKCSGNESTKKR